MEYGISKYSYYHGIFGTDAYFEVYRCDGEEDPVRGGTGIALFGNKEDAEEYLEWKQTREELKTGGTL